MWLPDSHIGSAGNQSFGEQNSRESAEMFVLQQEEFAAEALLA